MRNNVRVLRSVGSDLGASRLERWQQDRIVKNYVLDFPEFREISLFDPDGQVVVTSRTGKANRRGAQAGRLGAMALTSRPFKVDDDLLPTTTIAVRLGRSGEEMGWIVGEISLEELWRMVDRVRVGSQRLCADRRRRRPADRARQPGREAAHRDERDERSAARS